MLFKQCMLLSQYRLKLFELHGQRVKPVILLKSRTVAESREFFQMFADYMADTFGPEDIEKIRRNAAGIVKRMFGFFKEREISDQDLAAELRQAFSVEHLIFIDSRDKNLSEKQKKVNFCMLVFGANIDLPLFAHKGLSGGEQFF